MAFSGTDGTKMVMTREKVEDVKKRYIIIRFANDMVVDKFYATGSKPWSEYGDELRGDLF